MTDFNHFGYFALCPRCCSECTACKDKQYPAELTVTLAGIVNPGPPNDCRDCPNADGSWVLQQQGDCVAQDWPASTVMQSTATYVGSFPGVDLCRCSGQQATLQIRLIIVWNYGGVRGQRYVEVDVVNDLGCVFIGFSLLEQNQAEPFDCMDFSNLALSFAGAGAMCNSPAATCSVSA
ncbi:MAG: hypothetical protein ABR915_09085 [Thermoguttaceae bacterium]|jgi:hypothetical protein